MWHSSCMSAPIFKIPNVVSRNTWKCENVLFFLVALQAGNQGADWVVWSPRRRFWKVLIALRRPGKSSLIQASCSNAASAVLLCHCRISVLRCRTHAVSLMAVSCLFVPVNGKICGWMLVMGKSWYCITVFDYHPLCWTEWRLLDGRFSQNMWSCFRKLLQLKFTNIPPTATRNKGTRTHTHTRRSEAGNGHVPLGCCGHGE